MATDGPPASSSPSAASQAALAVFAGLTLLVLAVRGYGPAAGPRPTEFVPAGATFAVDLNAADRAELMQVPGVGPSLADAILTHRRDRGPFAAVDDLHAVKGIGGKTLDKIRPFVTVDGGKHPPDPAPDRAVETLERKPSAPAPARPAATPAPAPAAGSKVQPGDAPIDVNAADAAELQRLPGIGPTLAARIVVYRGIERFKSPDDLRRVKGVGPKTIESLRPYVVCR